MKLFMRLATASALVLTITSMAHAGDLDDIGPDLNPDTTTSAPADPPADEVPELSSSKTSPHSSASKSSGKSAGKSADKLASSTSNDDLLERETLPSPSIADDLSPDGPSHSGPVEPVLPTYPSAAQSRAATNKAAKLSRAQKAASKKEEARKAKILAKVEKADKIKASKLAAKAKASAKQNAKTALKSNSKSTSGGLSAADERMISANAVESAVNPTDGSDDAATYDPLVESAPETNSSQRTAEPVSRTQSLDRHNDMLSIDNESAQADQNAYEVINADNDREVSRLQAEVKSLERASKTARRSADIAKNRSDLTQKRLELQRKLKLQAASLLTQNERAQKRQESQLNHLRGRVESTEGSVSKARAQNKETERALRQEKREQATLEQRLKIATKRIADAKKQRQTLKQKHVKIAQKTRQLKHDVSRAENKADSTRKL